MAHDADAARTAAVNAARADVVTGALAAHGVDRVFVCPGSRSTPLVFALARRGTPTHVVLDERVAGFCAVGAARVGHASAVVTTSGTAVANLLPAACEALRDDLPWLALTADRPALDVLAGHNQTLEQPPLLVGACRAAVDLTGNDDDEAILHGALRGLQHPTNAGPVHANVRFDKPLEPPSSWPAPPLTTRAPAGAPSWDEAAAAQLQALLAERDGVVVVGALPASARAAAVSLVQRLHWPVFVDASAGLRVPGALSPALLRHPRVRAALQPRVALWIGGNLTDDAVAAWLAEHRVPVAQLSPTSTNKGAAARAQVHLVAAPALWERLHGVARVGPGVLAIASQLAAVVPHVMDDDVTAAKALSEPAVVRAVVQSARPGELLFIGNSMPIRDATSFATDVLADDVTVLSNRGVSGIDGNVATALGAVLASGKPCTVLLGDLALLHDLSGLAALVQHRAPVRVVVVNNSGGGIFSFLPVAQAEPQLVQRFFETPHPHALGPVAAALGLSVGAPGDLAALGAALSAAPAGPELLEVRTDRADNVEVHRRLHAAVGRACDEVLDAPVPLPWTVRTSP